MTTTSSNVAEVTVKAGEKEVMRLSLVPKHFGEAAIRRTYGIPASMTLWRNGEEIKS
jgi:hypothetical protein